MTQLLTILDKPYTIQATVYPCDNPISTILYLHGGGLIFGERDDLPISYLTLLQKNYRVVTVDYLLAPETSFDLIITTLKTTIEKIIDLLAISDNFCLFGRSAGAYLALLLTKQLTSSPRALISFYGYYNINLHQLLSPSQHYLTLPEVTTSLPLSKTPCHKPIHTYMLQYIQARQQGTWAQLLQLDTTNQQWQLTEEDCRQIPPTFITASINDPDVSYLFSSTLSQWLPKNHFVPVFHSAHDFDRDEQLGLPIYQQLFDWLTKVLK